MDIKNLPSEYEILNSIDADWSTPVVTCLCTTYNHATYIERALQGFLSQKTTFPFEILVHDDCSTDGTQKIIKSYMESYPNLIRGIFQSDNQYSKGKSPMLLAAYESKGTYVALCEGDDYWINDYKIQNQYDLMKNDDSITLIFCPSKIEFNKKVLDKLDCYYGEKKITFKAQDVINTKGHLAPTASYFLRKASLIASRKKFESAPVGDIFIELDCALDGKLVYLPQIGSVYRKQSENSWSTRMQSSLTANIKHAKSLEKIIKQVKELERYSIVDWNPLLSFTFSNLAVTHLKLGDTSGFKKYIEIANEYYKLTGSRQLLYKFRNHSQLLVLTIKPAIKIRNKVTELSRIR